MLARPLMILASAGLSTAHFLFQYPPAAGPFDEDKESESPCGGATVVYNSSSTQTHVEKFSISIKSTHPAGLWGIRGVNSTKEPYEFVDIVSTISTTGVGEFCLPEITAPKEWAGKGGIIQVIDYSIDGTLYQCAPVNWVSGSETSPGSHCKNATGFTATFTGKTTEEASATAKTDNSSIAHDDDAQPKSVYGNSNSTAGSPPSVLTNSTKAGGGNSTGIGASKGAGSMLTSTGSFLGLSALAAVMLL